jgi:hypothetical protein
MLELAIVYLPILKIPSEMMCEVVFCFVLFLADGPRLPHFSFLTECLLMTYATVA